MAITAPDQLYWKVLKEPKNGMKIAGLKGRKSGAVFLAPEQLVRFLVLEGIVGECDAQGNLKMPAPATPAAPTPPAAPAPPAGSGSSGGSSGSSTPAP